MKGGEQAPEASSSSTAITDVAPTPLAVRRAPPWRWRLSLPAAAALFLTTTLATHFLWLIAPLPSDLDIFIRVARDWAAGATLYVDTYDIKLPTVYGLVRLLDSRNPALTWYLAEAAYITIAATALFAAMRRAAPIAAFVAPMLMIAWPGTMGTGQQPEAVALALDVTALSLCIIAARTGRWWLGFVAGACVALMVSFRPPTLLHLVAYAPVLRVTYCKRGPGVTARATGAFLAGAAAVVAAVVAHAMVDGYWVAFLDRMRRNVEYASMSRVPLGQSVRRFAEQTQKLFMAWHAAPLLAMLTLAAVAPRWRAAQSLRSWGLWLVVAILWTVAAAAGTFPGGRHYEHYYHPLWAPLSVLAALWLTIVFPGRRRRPAALRLGLALVVFTTGYAALDTASVGITKAQAGMVRGTNQMVRLVADDLNRLIPRDEVAPMCVWSEWAELNWRVRRPSVTPVSAPILFVDMAPDLFDQWTTAMIERRPDVMVFDNWGLGPSSIKGRRSYKGRPRQDELQAMLRDDYVEIRRWSDLYVLARRGGPYDPAAAPEHPPRP